MNQHSKLNNLLDQHEQARQLALAARLEWEANPNSITETEYKVARSKCDKAWDKVDAEYDRLKQAGA